MVAEPIGHCIYTLLCFSCSYIHYLVSLSSFSLQVIICHCFSNSFNRTEIIIFSK